MKKLIVVALVLSSFFYLQANDANAMDICETNLTDCNNKCDTGDSSEACYQQCQETYESCLNQADGEMANPEGEEGEEPAKMKED